MPSKRTLLSAAVSAVGVVALVVWALDQPAPSWPGGTAELLALAAGLAAFAVATLLRAARWRSLAVAAGVPLGAGEAVSLTVSGYALNNVLPARAGDVYRGVTVARDGVPLAAAAGSIVAERVLDAAALGVLLLAALLVGPDGARLPEDLHGALVLGICAAGLAAVGLVAVLWRRARLFLVNLLSSLAAIGRRTVAIALLVSFVLWGLEALVYVLAGHAVGVPIDLLGAAYVLAIANLVGALPSAPSAVGTYDVAVVFAARSLGASGAAAVSYVLALRAVLFLPMTVIGILVLVVRRRQARPCAAGACGGTGPRAGTRTGRRAGTRAGRRAGRAGRSARLARAARRRHAGARRGRVDRRRARAGPHADPRPRRGLAGGRRRRRIARRHAAAAGADRRRRSAHRRAARPMLRPVRDPPRAGRSSRRRRSGTCTWTPTGRST